MTHTEREIRIAVLNHEVRSLREREVVCRRFKLIASADKLLERINDKLDLIKQLQERNHHALD